MKWVSHKFITGTLVYAITGNPVLGFISAAGSIVPDAVEGFPTDENAQNWRKNHRRLSHWWFPYFVISVLCYSYAAYHGFLNITLYNLMDLIHRPNLAAIGTYLVIAYFALGALLHIIEDAICGTVPGTTLQERVGIKLFRVGSVQEYIFTFGIGLTLLLVRSGLLYE